MRNPHFDDNLTIWSDDYSGQYEPPPQGYSEQFDLQWKTALEGNKDYFDNPGTSTDDRYIEDRVYEWIGKHPTRNGFVDGSMGSRVLDHPIDPMLIRGKKCIDIGCGMGRWTRVMQYIGAKEVLSIDISESAIKSVSKFNTNVLHTNIMEIPQEHPELVNKYDFANFWGVAMCTHDPVKAFKSAASTVKHGGAIYLMVYAPEGIHNTKIAKIQRRKFHALKSVEERLLYVDHIYNREFDRSYPISENIKNFIKKIIRYRKGKKTGILDLLEPFYNWVIPLDTINNWMQQNEFTKVTLLNEYEKPKCAYHVLGQKI